MEKTKTQLYQMTFKLLKAIFSPLRFNVLDEKGNNESIDYYGEPVYSNNCITIRLFRANSHILSKNKFSIAISATSKISDYELHADYFITADHILYFDIYKEMKGHGFSLQNLVYKRSDYKRFKYQGRIAGTMMHFTIPIGGLESSYRKHIDQPRKNSGETGHEKNSCQKERLVPIIIEREKYAPENEMIKSLVLNLIKESFHESNINIIIPKYKGNDFDSKTEYQKIMSNTHSFFSKCYQISPKNDFAVLLHHRSYFNYPEPFFYLGLAINSAPFRSRSYPSIKIVDFLLCYKVYKLMCGLGFNLNRMDGIGYIVPADYAWDLNELGTLYGTEMIFKFSLK